MQQLECVCCARACERRLAVGLPADAVCVPCEGACRVRTVVCVGGLGCAGVRSSVLGRRRAAGVPRRIWRCGSCVVKKRPQTPSLQPQRTTHAPRYAHKLKMIDKRFTFLSSSLSPIPRITMHPSQPLSLSLSLTLSACSTTPRPSPNYSNTSGRSPGQARPSTAPAGSRLRVRAVWALLADPMSSHSSSR